MPGDFAGDVVTIDALRRLDGIASLPRVLATGVLLGDEKVTALRLLGVLSSLSRLLTLEVLRTLEAVLGRLDSDPSSWPS